MFIPGIHNKNLPRIDVFYQGIKILREGIGDGEMLGCGAPFFPETGLYDILRVGPDTKDTWRDRFLNLIGYEGEISAISSLRNTLSRSFVTSKFFFRDPDVIFLKPKRLSRIERDSIIISNFFLSDVIFFSDPLYNLKEDDFSLLIKLKPFKNFILDDFIWRDWLFKFEGRVEDTKIFGYVNLNDRKVELELGGLEEILFDNKRNFIYPHETRVFIKR